MYVLLPLQRDTSRANHDPLLAAYRDAPDAQARSRALERLLATQVAPLVRSILSNHARAEWPIQRADAEDIAAQVNLRLIRKLEAALVLEEESVQNLEAYVVTLTRNAIFDLMRRNSPQRARMRSRFRYLFLHDSRLAIWDCDGVALCGLAEWRGRPESGAVLPKSLTAAMRDQRRPADAVLHLFHAVAAPLRLARVVAFFMDAWGISDEPAEPVDEPAEAATAEEQLASRQYLAILWEEISTLPERQRAALLLNLREPGSGNALLLFLVLGIAGTDALAAAIGMSRDELAAIWEQLPLDDLTIAARLGINRQQVINLRRSARERLARRINSVSNVSKK